MSQTFLDDLSDGGPAWTEADERQLREWIRLPHAWAFDLESQVREFHGVILERREAQALAKLLRRLPAITR